MFACACVSVLLCVECVGVSSRFLRSAVELAAARQGPRRWLRGHRSQHDDGQRRAQEGWLQSSLRWQVGLVRSGQATQLRREMHGRHFKQCHCMHTHTRTYAYLRSGMATAEHSPQGRGYDTSLFYFHHDNDYWTERVRRLRMNKISFHLHSKQLALSLHPSWRTRLHA